MKPQDSLTVIPKQSKLEYSALRKILNKWADNPADDNPLLQIFLDPGHPPLNHSWELLNPIPQKQKSLKEMILIRRLMSKLNNEQVT